MYLNIVMTFMLLVFVGNLIANFTYGSKMEEKQKELSNYNRQTNEEVLYLHRELLATELEILQELKRRK